MSNEWGATGEHDLPWVVVVDASRKKSRTRELKAQPIMHDGEIVHLR